MMGMIQVIITMKVPSLSTTDQQHSQMYFCSWNKNGMNALNLLAFYQHIFYASIQRVVHCHTYTHWLVQKQVILPKSTLSTLYHQTQKAAQATQQTQLSAWRVIAIQSVCPVKYIHMYVQLQLAWGVWWPVHMGKLLVLNKCVHQSQFLFHVLVTTAALQLLLINIVAFTTRPLSTTWHRCYHLLAC